MQIEDYFAHALFSQISYKTNYPTVGTISENYHTLEKAFARTSLCENHIKPENNELDARRHVEMALSTTGGIMVA